MFDENGRYTLILLRPDLPPFGSNNRTAGTPEENRAVVQGSIAHFGTYAVEGDTLVFRVEAATFPNWNGAEQNGRLRSQGVNSIHGPSGVGWGYGPSGLDPHQVEIVLTTRKSWLKWSAATLRS